MRNIFHSQSSPFVGVSLLLIATLVVGSCSDANNERPSQTDDVEAITALFASIVPVIWSDGADGLFTLFTDDVVLMVPDRWTDLNRQDAIAFYTEGFAEGKPDPDNYDITIEELVVTGDWAYVRQKSLGQIIPANGDPAYLQGSRHFTIVRRQPDGTWKIARDMFHWPPIDEAD